MRQRIQQVAASDPEFQDLLRRVQALGSEDRIRAAFDACRVAQARLSAQAAASFAPGDRVEFDSRHGWGIVGTVESVNRTTVTVGGCREKATGTTKGNYRVSPTLLRRVAPEGGAT